MSNAPLMPMATAVWLVENTTLTFKQIADFCKLHEVEIQGIADGEVAKGIKAYNPIISGQLSREEIELSSKDENRPLNIKSSDIEISNNEKKIKKYIPLSKRQDKPDSALWLIKQYPILKDLDCLPTINYKDIKIEEVDKIKQNIKLQDFKYYKSNIIARQSITMHECENKIFKINQPSKN